jgi:hypothetical protein
VPTQLFLQKDNFVIPFLDIFSADYLAMTRSERTYGGNNSSHEPQPLK